MLRNVSHFVDTQEDSEILYDTPFGYMFNFLCRCEEHLLPNNPLTVHYLRKLGEIMADPGTIGDAQPQLDSNIPSVYTYLGQFIDHDITARTDRETNFSKIGRANSVSPLSPNDVVEKLRNGRRPQLDLDSVFGEGPSFNSKYKAQADDLFNNTSLDLFLEEDTSDPNYIDLIRDRGVARIADHRNDENLMISQLHAAFIKLFNKINTNISGLNNAETYARARRLTCWVYQYIVINDYLKQVCDSDVVTDTLNNGPFFYNTSIPFMPLEFSVAGFRFGHSMIRPFYKINDSHTKSIMELLGPNMNGLLSGGKLKADHVIDWANYVQLNGAVPTNMARKVGPFIAKGLFDLSALNGGVMPPNVLASLTQRNLLRGYSLSIPTGQAIAKAMRITPLTSSEVTQGLNTEQTQLMLDSGFAESTPLWFYILQEAQVQQNANSLGYVGSKLVAETLIGLVKGDHNSYLNNVHDEAVTSDGIVLPGSTKSIQTIADLLEYAEVLPFVTA